MQEEDFEVLKWHDALLSSAADSAYLHLDIRHPEFFNGAVDERYNSLRQITASLHLWGGLERRTGCNAKELSQMRSWQGAQADHIIPVVFARRAIADVINTYSVSRCAFIGSLHTLHVLSVRFPVRWGGKADCTS